MFVEIKSADFQWLESVLKGGVSGGGGEQVVEVGQVGTTLDCKVGVGLSGESRKKRGG